ncbi:MAG: hypothetical protein ABR95_00275 [Sphingobacteriales bacterium BACL12 MAG-120813-bin55]|jgi:hypothetical protein|nr:MAG: hypothetical protein ABR94_07640 [Sphingobacteriales bacterium BACL12 MAG-120802-bin5]KRP13287.1 MAG: hypothetical protein ABR95_00275 [Sphingobacteriales bacterium BACL12 MAG-120813-bin55]
MKGLNDDKMWEMAEKRVGFRRHFFVYALINIIIISLWFFTSYKDADKGGYWFVFPLLGWGIGLAFHYWAAFHDDLSSIEKEYQKLKEKYQVDEEVDAETKDTSGNTRRF